MRVLIMLVGNAFGIVAAMAQSPFGLVSSVESGWTSNATESPGGSPDFYLRHNHDLSLRSVTGPLSLRAGLLLEQQVFRHHAGENDLSVTGGVEAGLALGEGVALRLGYALSHEWTGEMLDLAPIMLTITSPAIEHEALGELIVSGDGRAASIGMDLRRRLPGVSEFDGLPLAPAIIDSEVVQVTARADGEWVINPEIAALARLHWIVASVPEADRAGFGREPASVARLAGGLRLRQDLLTAEARAGIDLVWPEAAPSLMLRMPYLDASVELAVTEQLRLTARAFAGVEVFNPVDGVASGKLETEVGSRYALSDRLALSMGLAFSREQGLYDEALSTSRRGLNGGMIFSFASGLEAGLLASHAQVDDAGAVYEVSTIGLTLVGKV